MSNESSLTPRQRFWLEHLRRCTELGQPLSAYAAEHGLSLCALYEAKRCLRRRGLWPAAASGRFVRVQLSPETTKAALNSVYRISLPNRVVVEVAGGDLGAVLSAAARLS
jgi:hypothetical protein